jgi:fumarate hydratase subunit beta
MAYAELGPEAVYQFEVENFPAIVAIDCRGQTLFKT